jgi:3-oxoacyl-[acyl-carrier protein] reductase
MDLCVEGRVALVTAASSGLGLASARALAAEGASVVITGRREDALAAAAADLRTTGAEILAIPGDITTARTPAATVERVVDELGGLDILVPNAGGPPAGRALEVTDEEVLAAVNANLLTTVRLVRAARPHLARSGQGRVCCITSVSVVQPFPQLALSNLSRTGLWAWAKTAAQDLRPEGTTLNLACPGPHRTSRAADLGMDESAGDPGDFGKIVAFLCSRAAAFVTATTVVVDGGMTLGL